MPGMTASGMLGSKARGIWQAKLSAFTLSSCRTVLPGLNLPRPKRLLSSYPHSVRLHGCQLDGRSSQMLHAWSALTSEDAYREEHCEGKHDPSKDPTASPLLLVGPQHLPVDLQFRASMTQKSLPVEAAQKYTGSHHRGYVIAISHMHAHTSRQIVHGACKCGLLGLLRGLLHTSAARR